MRTHIFAQLVILVALVALVALGAAPAEAKRKAPPKPISAEFVGKTFTTSSEKCGVVEVRDRKTGKLVKRIRFYRVFYWPKLERDVQDVWFTSLFIQGDDLWARDEKGRIYKMSLKLLKPRRVKYVSAEEFEKMEKEATP